MGRDHSLLIWALVVFVEAACAVFAWERALRHREHKPVALLAVFALVADCAAKVIQQTLLGRASPPFCGIHRVAYHVETALFLGWPAALLAVSVVVFHGRSVLPVIAGWVLTNVVLIWAYPLPTEWTQPVFRAFECVALVAIARAAATAWRKRWGVPHAVVLLLAGGELVVVSVGPYATDIYRDWEVATVLYTVAFVLLVLLHLALLIVPLTPRRRTG